MLPLALLAALALPASAQKPPKPPKPSLELVELTAVDLRTRPDLAEAALRLPTVFQVFLDQRTLAKPKGGAPASPEEPYLLANCTASYIGGGRVATARHCGHAGPWDKMVFRRWQYRLAAGRLEAAGHEDYRVRARPVGEFADLVVLALDGEFSGSEALAPAGSGEPAPGAEFLSLGYPNEFSARPFAGVGCRVLKATSAETPGEYRAACRITGGMSGGPQILRGAAVQLGVNSTSQGDSTAQPRLSALPL